ncbi:DUF6334 family protein [Pseudoalteromonas sp. YIC-656]|uniref:DUF6334 family protein n=1 Tax=Pseudoalteromonas pernae TaxID=3118054 RepID=UPI003242C8B9
MELSKLVQHAGKLEDAKAYSFPELEGEIAAIKLRFQHLSCAVQLLESTDEISLSEHIDLKDLKESNASLIFHNCVGSELVWCWSMVNNQGYLDGLKFQFLNDIAFELVAIASSIKQLKVTES